MRWMGRGTDSLLADNFFVRAISSTADRDEIIKLVLIYGWDKPYSVQKAIGEECLKEQYYVNDSLKYIALNYAIDGNYNQDEYDMDIIRDYSRERMRIAAVVFGEDSPEAYNALFECVQLTQFENGKEVDVADYFEDPVVSAWLKRESYPEQELESFISGVNPSVVWNRCLFKYDDVNRALSPGESAVEIVKTHPLSGGDEFYSALIINYGNPKPIRKELCESQTLVQLFQAGHIYDNKPTHFYAQIIGPLLAAVTGSTIYLSSTGLFSLINITSTSNGQGVRVSDARNIINCISTKVICDERMSNAHVFPSIALFGGMEFEKGNHTTHFSEKNHVDRDIERDGFGFLPATLEEVEAIDSIANSHSIQSYLYTGLNGTEAEFRSFSGKAVSIIHLATHGFYYNPTESVSGGYINLLGNEDNALNRCGLILADSQDTWKNGIDQYDNDNGILLGSEIANLDLLNTDLVVLAACNTGLGDISNEGISGLQQAFKRAGVHALLLSLKPISDDATKLFMIEFYNHLFAGEMLQKSYYAAINRLMSHPLYSEPDYWSSYVLLI